VLLSEHQSPNDVPIPAGDDTDAVVASDRTAYVLDTGSHEAVTPVSLATGKVGKPIKVGAAPDSMAFGQ
jgi:hypothetical protein